MTTTSATDRALPLESAPVRTEAGWSLRLPVRADEVNISKQTAVHERVVVNRKWVQGVASFDAVLRREQLHTSRSGPVQVREDDLDLHR